MINYLKFEMSNVIGNTVESVSNYFHTLSGDQDIVARVFASFCDSKCDAATRFMLTEPSVFDSYKKGVWEWHDRAVRDVQRSAHNEWVRTKVIELLRQEVEGA